MSQYLTKLNVYNIDKKFLWKVILSG